jgi:hypothetical protein
MSNAEPGTEIGVHLAAGDLLGILCLAQCRLGWCLVRVARLVERIRVGLTKATLMHPILLATFPPLFVYSINVDRIRPRAVVGPIVVILLATLVLWLLVTVVLRDARRAAMILSLFLLLFFSFGICYLELVGVLAGVSASISAGLPAALLTVWSFLFALGTYAFVKTERNVQDLMSIVTVVAGCLVVTCLIQIGIRQQRAPQVEPGDLYATELEAGSTASTDVDSLPDIYYIILDGYARSDVLQQVYDLDNRGFLESLEARGFYVGSESRANYCQTLLSLASSLNLNYLDGLVDRVGAEYSGTGPAVEMIRDNIVVQLLKQRGYRVVAFASGYSGTELKTADVYLAPRRYPDEFQVSLINMTPIPFIAQPFSDMYDWHRERILYTFEHMADAAELDGPTFVFAHIVAPHPPFVFGRNGEEMDPEYQFVLHDGSHLVGNRGFTQEDYVQGYREQLLFINTKVTAAVDAILSRSDRPAIIVLQGDHGPGSMLDWQSAERSNLEERFSILNAYYLPGDREEGLYDQITPVNTFRFIFNSYFGTEYARLEDKSYFSTAGRQYSLQSLTDELGVDAQIARDDGS